MRDMANGSEEFLDSVEALAERLSRDEPKRIAIVTHKRADVDALASASALRGCILTLLPSSRVTVHSQGRLPLKSKGLVEFLGLEIIREVPAIDDSSWVALVDSGELGTTGLSRGQLAGAKCRILVDHHPLVDQDIYDIVLHQLSTSTSEVVLEILTALRHAPDEKESTALLAGIITDTAGLKEANERTFEHMCALRSYGAEISKAWEVVYREASRGERIAKIKAAQRMKVLKSGELVVVITEVGSFHASVASSLVRLGADMAVVFSDEKHGSKASLRASKRFSEVSSKSVGALSAQLGEELGGHGGGHIRAGALSTTRSTRESLSIAKEFIAKHLSQ